MFRCFLSFNAEAKPENMIVLKINTSLPKVSFGVVHDFYYFVPSGWHQAGISWAATS
jgi:hypothetical protein